MIPSSQPLGAPITGCKTYTHFLHHWSAIARQRDHPGLFAGLGRDAGDRRAGDTPVGDQPWETRGPRRGGAARGQSLRKSPEGSHFLAKSARTRGRAGASSPGPLGPTSPTRAGGRAPEPAPAAAPSAPAQLSARLIDASSPPAAAQGVFVYIRAPWPALRRRVCHQLAIIFTHACGSAGSWFGRGTVAFLSPAPPPPPSLPGCTYFTRCLARGGRCSSPFRLRRRSRFASLSPGEWNYLFIYVPRLVLARRTRRRRGWRVEGRRGG